MQDSFPNQPHTAEKEFIARFSIACKLLGHECQTVATSDEITAYSPDAVMVTHEYSPKLTKYPTVGLVWSPISFFRNDPYRVRALSSLDGYLPGSAGVQRYLADLQAFKGASKPVCGKLFPPTTYRTTAHSFHDQRAPSLCYLGTQWDRQRHEDLLIELVRRKLLTVYGPAASWSHLQTGYGGEIPFDGRAALETIRRHGMSLCLHKNEHRVEDIPSMRLFETCAVGALPFCDNIPFAQEHLRDSAMFIDVEQSTSVVADNIEEAISYALTYADSAQQRANAANGWFEADWSLEDKISTVAIPFIEQVVDRGSFRYSPPKHRPLPECQVIVRTGARESLYLQRALGSLCEANSQEFPIAAIVVDFANRPDLEAVCKAVRAQDLRVDYIKSPQTGFRSTSLWDGLRHATSPFVAQLDDDDDVFPNHYRQLAKALVAAPDARVCYSGTIKVEDDDGVYFHAPNFVGPSTLPIAERRELKFLSSFDQDKLISISENFIQSNAWMAKTTFVQSVMGGDPELEVSEDVYLYLLMAAHGPFAFTGSPTAQWHWRTRTGDNSMIAVERSKWDRDVSRVRARMSEVLFQTTATFSDLCTRPRSKAPSLPTQRCFSIDQDATALQKGTIICGQPVTVNTYRAGQLYIKGRSKILRMKASSTGVFEIPMAFAEDETSYLFVPYDINTPPIVVDFHFSAESEKIGWITLGRGGVIKLCGFAELGRYSEQLLLEVAIRDNSLYKTRFLLEGRSDGVYLKARPVFGASWHLLHKADEHSDNHGPLRCLRLTSLLATLEEPRAFPELLRIITVSAIEELQCRGPASGSTLLLRAVRVMVPYDDDRHELRL